MAAALAYRTIFSLIPILILSFLVLRLFRDDRALVQQMLSRALDLAGLDQLRLSDAQEVSVQGRLESLVSSFSGLSFTGIGLVSAATLIYAALSLIIEVENSFNRVYNVPRGRQWTSRLTRYWLLISLGPLLVFASFFVAERFTGMAQQLAQQGAGALGPWVVGVTGYLVSVAITTLLLLTVYLTVPNARIAWRAGLAGAALGAVLLELGKYGFKLYLDHAGLRTLYGSLALIPMFLLWLYVTWVIVLVGLRSAYLVQHGHRLGLLSLVAQRAAGSLGAGEGAWLEPARMLVIAQVVGADFGAGKRPDIERLAGATDLPEPALRAALASLVERGVLVQLTESGPRASPVERFTLARPADRIALADVLAAAHDLAGPPRHALTQQLRSAERAALGERTLADLLTTPAAPAGTTPPELAHA